MDEGRYRLLVRIAILLTAAWIGWTLFGSDMQESKPGAHELSAAGRYLEDGKFDKALEAFSKVLKMDPENLGALRGQAQSHMRMGLRDAFTAERLTQDGQKIKAATLRRVSTRQLQTALNLYNESIRREQARGISDTNQLALGVARANRGILRDQMGDYEGALVDYREALKLAPEVKEGPGFLTRFMRNQSEKPPSVADRAHYLEQQLAKPVDQQRLRLPSEDAQQQSYKLE